MQDMRPPNIKDFEWDGSRAHTEFKVSCKPGVVEEAATSVACGADIIEGTTAIRLSFQLKVVTAEGMAWSKANGELELDTSMTSVRANVARIDPADLIIEEELGKGIQVMHTWMDQ